MGSFTKRTDEVTARQIACVRDLLDGGIALCLREQHVFGPRLQHTGQPPVFTFGLARCAAIPIYQMRPYHYAQLLDKEWAGLALAFQRKRQYLRKVTKDRVFAAGK
ncbi:hypothetical protein PTKU15_87730 [Paraburkholderia terrae]|nr:hypothetical protein PTKU15_87730 [Paraburkholderia terrae]